MTFELSGPQRAELRAALLDAFPTWSELEMLLSDQLDWKLAQISSGQLPLSTNVFQLIEWAKGRGWLAKLVLAARNERPDQVRLSQLAASASLSSTASIPAASLEKIVSNNISFLDVSRWGAQLVKAEWRVCRIDRGGKGQGTGFLVGPDLMLTNHHVVAELLASPANVGLWSCRFDHKLSPEGDVILMGRTAQLAASDWCIDTLPHSPMDMALDPKPTDPTDEELDFALLRLAEPIGAQPIGQSAASAPRGWLKLSTTPVNYGLQRVVAILGHPQTSPMKLSLGLDQQVVLNKAQNRIRYTVPTDSGSSGSPVFDGDFNLVALHHSGDPRTVNPTYNEGIPIAKIAARPKVAAVVPA